MKVFVLYNTFCSSEMLGVFKSHEKALEMVHKICGDMEWPGHAWQDLMSIKEVEFYD